MPVVHSTTSRLKSHNIVTSFLSLFMLRYLWAGFPPWRLEIKTPRVVTASRQHPNTRVGLPHEHRLA